MVFGPVIQVTVPSVRVPASLSSCGPRAATTTGTGVESGMVSATLLAVSVSPAKAAVSSCSSGIRIDRYSRRWRTGLAKSMPSSDSMTIWCERPMPSVKPASVIWWTVRAWAAITIGCRG